MNPFKHFENILASYIKPDAIKILLFKWNEPTRFYHNTKHLTQIIKDIESNAWFSELSVFEKHCLLVAAFFHDVIYDTKIKDNEDKSIEFFKRSYKGNDPEFISTVTRLIEATKYRKRPINKLERIFWDADNSGFKKGYTQLLKNEKLIQQEWKWMPKEKFKEGKIEFLKSNFGLFGKSVDKDLEKLIEYYKKF
jgi:predicted metal-dependent HD superfamily phosphohydrolase